MKTCFKDATALLNLNNNSDVLKLLIYSIENYLLHFWRLCANKLHILWLVICDATIPTNKFLP